MASVEEDEFIKKLIMLVQQHKLLYDKRDPFFFDTVKKEEVWEEIGRQTNKTSCECKTKWLELSERFYRELRKEDMPSGSRGFEATELFYNMIFLKDSMKSQRPRCNEFFESASSSNECSFNSHREQANISSVSASSHAKRKKTEFFNAFEKAVKNLETRLRISSEPVSATDDNGDELFMKLVHSLMKDLPESVKDAFKTEMFIKIMEIRRQHRNE